VRRAVRRDLPIIFNIPLYLQFLNTLN
jgi:hypothetical protein